MDPRLRKYVKDHDPGLTDPVPTSVTLDRRHATFVKVNKLNLSRLVRDYLDQVMGRTTGAEAPKGINDGTDQE